ncbi:MAG: phage tail protein [Candidatus Promineifilaceae bacterium]
MGSRRANPLTSPEPHSSFRFAVVISGITQAVFTDCTLPNIEWDIQEIKEGGLNTYTHQLPGRRKGTKITLKNGLVRDDLLDWYNNMMGERFQETRKTVDITLLDAMHNPVIIWSCEGAYPTKWTGPDFKAGDNAVATQTLELACARVTFERQ